MPFIELRDVAVIINGNTIIERVSFDIDKGDVVSIIGPNGSGKTTLVRSMLGLMPHHGTVTMESRPIMQQLSRVGYVPQRFDFDRTFPLSVNEFLDLPGIHNPALKEELCREFGVTALLKKKLGTLSGGQMQRVLIISAMLKSPDLLILDEPTSGVDVEGTANFYELVRHLNREHKITIILISHEVNMVLTTATKVICLNKSLYCCGEPSKVLTDEMLEKLYSTHFEKRDHGHHH
jgi:zinc transport system ATP-binding protein